MTTSPKEFTGTLSPDDIPKIEEMRKTVKLIIDGLSCPGHSYKYVFGLTDLEESDSYIMEQRELFIRKKTHTKFEGGYSSDDENMRIIINDRAIMFHNYKETRDYDYVLSRMVYYVSFSSSVQYIDYKCITAYISFANYFINDLIMLQDLEILNIYIKHIIKILYYCSEGYNNVGSPSPYSPNEEQIAIYKIKFLLIILNSLILYINISKIIHNDYTWDKIYELIYSVINIDEMCESYNFIEEKILIDKIIYYINMCKPRPLQYGFICCVYGAFFVPLCAILIHILKLIILIFILYMIYIKY
jgi:hypothetical protein